MQPKRHFIKGSHSFRIGELSVPHLYLTLPVLYTSTSILPQMATSDNRFNNDSLRSHKNLVFNTSSASTVPNIKKEEVLKNQYAQFMGFQDPHFLNPHSSIFISNIIADYCSCGKQDALKRIPWTHSSKEFASCTSMQYTGGHGGLTNREHRPWKSFHFQPTSGYSGTIRYHTP